jgi:alkyl hydroperoxide reductase subunit AhpF
MSNATQIDDNKARRCSLMRLQKEYLEKTLQKLDETIELSSTLDDSSDPELIISYLNQIKALEAEVDQLYAVACGIEERIK